MPITYPRALPAFLTGRTTSVCGFDLDEATTSSRTLGGIPLAAQLADPHWKFSLTSIPLDLDRVDELKAWWASLRGGGKSFLAYDIRRKFPISYPQGVAALTRAGGGAFDGTAKLAALSPSSISVGATGGFLPASFSFKTGDTVGLVSTVTPTRYTVHRVMEDATASVGGVAVLNVYPFVLTTRFAIGDTVNTVSPLAEFVPERDSWSHDSTREQSTVSFAARSRAY